MTKVGAEVALTVFATEAWAVTEGAGAVQGAPVVMGSNGEAEAERGPAVSSGARFLLLWIE